MFVPYPIVNDSCLCIIFIKCIFDFFLEYMGYKLCDHILFEGCEGLRGVTLYYMTPKKYKRNVL